MEANTSLKHTRSLFWKKLIEITEASPWQSPVIFFSSTWFFFICVPWGKKKRLEILFIDSRVYIIVWEVKGTLVVSAN